MRRIRKNGLPKYCSWNRDAAGCRTVRFRHGAIDAYLKGTLFTEVGGGSTATRCKASSQIAATSPHLLAPYRAR